MSKRLSAVSNSKDNNYNLLRFGAALMVFISHCPEIFGMSIVPITELLAYVAVNVFFIISGFLVAKSLFLKKNVLQFMFARALRVYPALILAVVYTVFVVGLMFSTLPAQEFLQHKQTWYYFASNILQFSNTAPTMLPGLAGWHLVNGPLWTLPYEIHMYFLLAFIGSVGFTVKANLRKLFWEFYFFCVVVAAAFYFTNYAYLLDTFQLGNNRDYLRFMAMFGAGVGAFFFQDKIILDTKYFIAIIILVVASSPFRILFVCISYGLLAYMVLYLAYVPGGFLRKFNQLGDYSYGIYIFGYPTQKAVMTMFPDINVFELFAMSFTITLFIAIMSWHLLEKPMLKLKRY